MGGVSSTIGSVLGGTAGFLVGGPVGAAAGASLGGTIGGGMDSSTAAKKASNAQYDAATAGIQEQQRQFDAIVEMMKPFLTTGTTALAQQGNLLGIGGSDAQQQAINQLKNSPLYTSLLEQGENRLLQNASATGGLRGGNTQAAIGQLAPSIFNTVYQNQLANLGVLSGMGQASAGLQANAGQNTAAGISNLLAQQGAAKAGGILGAQNANTQATNSLSKILGGFI